MKKPTRLPARSFHVPRWCAWLPLVPLLAGACKPRDLVCKTEAVFQSLNPEQGAGAAPFSIERLGPEANKRVLHNVPTYITLRDDNRARVDWMVLVHIYRYADLLYSPAEGIARNVDDPKRVYPMRRFSDGASERALFGFRSTACRDQNRGSAACEFGEEELFLVAEMTCQRE